MLMGREIWAVEAGLGLWAGEADTWLVADCWPLLVRSIADVIHQSVSPLGCRMGHAWPGEQEG